MTAQPSFWRLLSVCFRYAKKRGCGAGFGKLAPSDLSQYFLVLIFADGGTWSTGSAHGLFPPCLPSGGWCMKAEDADGSLWDGDHLGDMSEEKETTRQEQPSAPHVEGPHLWEDNVGLNLPLDWELSPVYKHVMTTRAVHTYVGLSLAMQNVKPAALRGSRVSDIYYNN